MAIYHFEAKVITRGVGRSVVAASAYASCSQIYNDYDGIQHFNYNHFILVLYTTKILTAIPREKTGF